MVAAIVSNRKHRVYSLFDSPLFCFFFTSSFLHSFPRRERRRIRQTLKRESQVKREREKGERRYGDNSTDKEKRKESLKRKDKRMRRAKELSGCVTRRAPTLHIFIIDIGNLNVRPHQTTFPLLLFSFLFRAFVAVVFPLSVSIL